MFLIYISIIWAAMLGHIAYRAYVCIGLKKNEGIFLTTFIFLAGFAYIPARLLINSGRIECLAVGLEYAATWFIGIAAIVWTLLISLESGAFLFWLTTHRRIRDTRLHTRRLIAVVISAAALGLAAIGFITARSEPTISTVKITIPDTETRRFVMICDSHLGAVSSPAQWHQTLITVQNLKPDALLIAGDLIDDNSKYTAPQVKLLRDILPRIPIYIITGNHEFYAGIPYFKKLCKSLNLTLLRQEAALLPSGIMIAGIDDEHLLPAKTAITKIKPKLKGPVLFLTHRPSTAHLLKERPMTVILSGHTHGGQTLPLVFLASLGNGGFLSGYYKVGEADLYVSRGTGYWGPPIRLFAPPELVLIEILPGSHYEITVQDQ